MPTIESPAAMHALQRVLGNRTVSRLIAQREPTCSSDTVKKLLATPAADIPDAVIKDHGLWLRNATPIEISKLIAGCIDANVPLSGGAIDTLLNGASDWRKVAEANLSLWDRAVRMLPPGDRFYRTLADTFAQDTEEVANGYLRMNEDYCDDTLKGIAYTRDGKPIVGPPTAEQQTARDTLVNKEAAQSLLDMQKKLIEARQTKLGTQKKAVAGGRFGWVQVSEVNFDPERRPPDPSPNYTPDPAAKPYDELKKAYDMGVEALRDHLSLHPNLYVLVRDKFEDVSRSQQVVDGKDSQGVIAAELARTITNIATARPYVRTAAKEMTPIHRQLREGKVTSPAKQDRNWSADPVWRPVADVYSERSGDPPWWQTLGVSALEMAVFAVAGLATGGIGFAAAMMLKSGAEAAMAAGKASVLAAAAQANVRDDTKLVDSRTADEARAEAAMAVAFAALDAVMLGAEFRAAKIAGKVASSQTGQAIIAIEREAQVLEMERKLLGKVEEAEAKDLATRATTLAEEARKAAQDADGLASKGAQEASRARVAKAAADRAEKAASRVKELAAKVGVKAAVPEEQLAKAIPPIPIKDGKVILSKAGLFVCHSPCMLLTEKYAAVISRNPELAERAVAVRMAERDAGMIRDGLKGASAKAVEKRIKDLVETFERECQLFEKAEGVTAWLKQAGSAETKELDAAAVTRILRRGPHVEAAKGQLLEEIAAVRIRTMLLDSGERMKLAGKHAGEALEFIPGHRLRDSNGRQFTDGVIGFWQGETFRIVTIIESKAGRTAAEGLKYSKDDLQAIANARWKLMRQARKGEVSLRPDEVWAIPNREFEQIYKKEVDAARRAKGGDEWRNLVGDEVKDQVIEELRAAGNHQRADQIAGMKRAEFEKIAEYGKRVKKAQEAAPLPEGGQFALDIERGNEFGGQLLQGGELPRVVEKGPWKDGVPPGTWKPTQFATSAGSTRVQGFVPKDADAAGIAAELGAQKLQGQITQTRMTTEGFGKLAGDILEKGK